MIESAAKGENSVIVTIINQSTSSIDEVSNGFIIGRHNLDGAYYEELTEAAFDLENGEVSPVIRITTGEEDGYYIMYRTEKTEYNFAKCFYNVLYVYLKDKIGEKFDTAENGLKAGCEWNDELELNYAEISME